jgi:hypothetical protein
LRFAATGPNRHRRLFRRLSSLQNTAFKAANGLRDPKLSENTPKPSIHFHTHATEEISKSALIHSLLTGPFSAPWLAAGARSVVM